MKNLGQAIPKTICSYNYCYYYDGGGDVGCGGDGDHGDVNNSFRQKSIAKSASANIGNM